MWLCNVWGLLVLCRLLCPGLGVQGHLKELSSDEDSSSLICGHRGLEFVLPLSLEGNASALTVMDRAGVSHTLQNDSTCGTWVTQKPDGSLVIGAYYTGCYMSEQDGKYKMTIGIEGTLDGQRIRQQRQVKCSVLLAMDAPSPDMCSAISTADRVSCGRIPITQSACDEQGCCYNPRDSSMPCYYGNPVTARCTPDGQAVIAVSKYATVPYLSLETVRLLTVTSACSDLRVISSGAFLVYEFPLSCGSSYQDGVATVYENRLESTKDVRSAGGWSITRHTTFSLTVRCSFTSSSSSFVPLSVVVFTLPPPPPVVSPGPLFLEMRIARDDTYRSYYADGDYPVVKLFREPVHVEVRVLQRTDPSLVLVLNQCWATSSSSPVERPQWPILVERCPYAGDNYRTLIVPVDASSSELQFRSHYQRFAVSTFTFVDNRLQNIRGQIYFHCSASVCVPSALESCSTVCPSRRKRMTKDWDMEHLNLVTAEGPVYFDIEEEADFSLLEGSRSGLSMVPEWTRAALVAVGFLVFLVLGILVVAQFVGLLKYCNDRKLDTGALKA